MYNKRNEDFLEVDMLSSSFKRFLAALLVGVLAISLFACAPQTDRDDESADATTDSSSNPDDTKTPESSDTELGGETVDIGNEVGDTTESTDNSVETSRETDKNDESDKVTDKETTNETEKETENEKSCIEGFEIDEKGGSASVKSPDGLKYDISGYENIGKTGFVFDKTANISFDAPFSASFNRFSIKYRSTTALKIFVAYTESGVLREDYYFLERGEGVFSGLVPEFLSGKKGTAITGIRIENLEGEKAEFAVLDFESETVSVPSREYYIRGSRYTLGIDLGWGGTINYVSDNQCPIAGVENMINKHDTGRLVQQSYYGTGEKEGIDFEWGSFNGSDKWPYNPVQGGGQGNVASRLIDFKVFDNGNVYIKVQPMDWGKRDIKYITPSYMENWYIIEDDYIKVDNRFVDFSGWEHPCNSQELPAFYTISYLDSFVWYDGVEPWTGDELSWRHELRFWGDSQYAGECSFRVKVPNTETWCAWVSTEDNYGIGVYTPNIDRYSAGRYQYIETFGVSTGTSGTKNPAGGPTNYVAPWKQIQLISFEALEYSYLICAGSVDEIRATFTENKDLFDNASLSENSVSNRQPFYDEEMDELDFTVEGNEKFAAYPNATEVSYDKSESALKLTSMSGDVHITFDYLASPYILSAEDYRYIEIVYMIPKTNANSNYPCQLFICAGARVGAAEADSVRSSLIADGNYHTLRVRLDDKAYWTGRVNLIRFDYFNASSNGDVIYIRSVKLTDGAVANMEKVDFTKVDGAALISKTNNTSVVFDNEKNATRLEVIGKDPYFIIDYSVNSEILQASDYSKLRITYMVPEGQSTSNFSYCVFPCAGSITGPTSQAQIYSATGIIADGEYHTLEIDLSQYAFWDGNINMIRLDYFNSCEVGDVFYITSFELVK